MKGAQNGSTAVLSFHIRLKSILSIRAPCQQIAENHIGTLADSEQCEISWVAIFT